MYFCISFYKLQITKLMKKKAKSQTRLMHLEKIGFRLEAQKLRKDYSNRNKFNEIKHQQKSQSRKKILSHIQSTNNIGHFLQPTRIISVSAHKWVIYDFYSIRYIRGYRAHNKAQLGVFSKLLVFCTINTLIKKHKIDPTKFQTIVTKSVLQMFPKQKRLKVDDILSLEDILHLMILDQSEIYEVILSANVGAYLYKKHRHQYYSVYDVHQRTLKEHLKYFYELVNGYCKLMHFQNINYVESDPSLRKEFNKCSASDVAKLSIDCMNIPLYQNILKKEQHSAEVKYVDDKGHLSSGHIVIKNHCIDHKYIHYTNICRNMEEKQFLSSHCSILYEDQNVEVRPILVVLLGCYSPNDRQKDIQQIVEWYLKSQNVLQKPQQTLKTKILKTQPTQSVQAILEAKIQQKLAQSPSNERYSLNLNSDRNKRIRKVVNLKTQQ